MNKFSGYAKPIYNGWWGMVRFAKDGHPKPIMGEGDKPVVYRTELEAVKAVNERILKYFNGDYRRSGETLSAARSEAEMLFRGGGKVIQIERRAKA